MLARTRSLGGAMHSALVDDVKVKFPHSFSPTENWIEESKPVPRSVICPPVHGNSSGEVPSSDGHGAEGETHPSQRQSRNCTRRTQRPAQPRHIIRSEQQCSSAPVISSSCAQTLGAKWGCWVWGNFGFWNVIPIISSIKSAYPGTRVPGYESLAMTPNRHKKKSEIVRNRPHAPLPKFPLWIGSAHNPLPGADRMEVSALLPLQLYPGSDPSGRIGTVLNLKRLRQRSNFKLVQVGCRGNLNGVTHCDSGCTCCQCFHSIILQAGILAALRLRALPNLKLSDRSCWHAIPPAYGLRR
eukprot:1453409-Rhodomonas_salina.3